MSIFGVECQSNSSTDTLAIIREVRSGVLCASTCNRQPLCRFFVYDTSTKVCRIFKDGSIVTSSSTTSRVGSLRYTPDLYAAYARPCAWNTCEINRYTVCNVFSRCQCPTGLVWNTQTCVGELLRVRIRVSCFFLVEVGNFSYQWNTTGDTVAGVTGSADVTANRLSMPMSVAVDTSKTLYISDFGNNRVQKFLAGATNGTTVAGNFNGTSGSDLSALDSPYGIAIDSSHGVYVADASNNRIVYWGNGSSVGRMVAGTGEKIAQKCSAQSSRLYESKASSPIFSLFVGCHR